MIKLLSLAAASTLILGSAAMAQTGADAPTTVNPQGEPTPAPGQFDTGPNARPLSMKPAAPTASELGASTTAAPSIGATPPSAPYSAAPPATSYGAAQPSPYDSATASAQVGTSADASASSNLAPPGTMLAGTETVASEPVPDTQENRAQYGAPMSSAGKRSAAAGN